MPQITESNITLNFPDNNYFRFEDCPGYHALSAYSFKEMDACWHDQAGNIYWIIELKDFSLASLSTSPNVEDRAQNIFKKAVASLSMFLSSIHGYSYGSKLNACFPVPPPDKTTKLNFVAIVHCNNAQIPDVQLIHNSFRNKFKPYAELFDISNYAVIEHAQAIRTIPYRLVS